LSIHVENHHYILVITKLGTTYTRLGFETQ
jgi:hypothetical protein